MTQRIEQDFIVIGGWSFAQPGGPKQIIHNRGNKFGERNVKVLENLDFNTKYDRAKEVAEGHAQKLGYRMGRDFSAEEWSGRIKAEGPYGPYRMKKMVSSEVKA